MLRKTLIIAVLFVKTVQNVRKGLDFSGIRVWYAHTYIHIQTTTIATHTQPSQYYKTICKAYPTIHNTHTNHAYSAHLLVEGC